MKRIVLALALFLAPTLAWGQCSGVFPDGSVCGNKTGAAATPRATPSTSFVPALANPTASVGLTAVNGTATTAMRSDAAPPLSSAIQSALTATNHSVTLGTGAFGFSSTSPSTSGQPLRSTGATTDPAFGTIDGNAFATQTANTIFAGPTSGGVAIPAFRALTSADLPNTAFYSGTVTAGSANAQTITTPTPVNYTLASGNTVCAKAGFTNTGATTLSVNGTTATAINARSTNGLSALVGGEIKVGLSYCWQYDGTVYEQLLSTPGAVEEKSTNYVATAVDGNGDTYIFTAAATLTVPHSTTIPNNWKLFIFALGGAVTVTPDAADAINGGTIGASITISQGFSSFVTTDGAGNIYAPIAGSGSPGGSNTQVQYNNSGSFAGTSGATATATQVTLNSPIIDTTTTWKYSGTSVGTEAVSNPASTSPVNSYVTIWQGSSASATTSLHVLPAAGAVTANTITEIVTGTTATQAFGGNYGRWSLTNQGSALSYESGIFGEYGGATATGAMGPFIVQLGVENPPSTFNTYEYFRLNTTAGGAEDNQIGSIAFGANQPSPGTQQNRIAIIKPSIGSAGQRDSDAILWEGKANDGTERAVWWRQFVDVTSNAGASTFTLQSNLNGGGWNTYATVTDAGALTVSTINAFTLGGTIAGGGNQLNNIIIGTTTPLAGSFTTLSGSTSTTTPIVYGGSAAGSSLALTSTSNGAPSADFISFTQGGVEAQRFTGGKLIRGATSAQVMGATGAINPTVQTYAAAGGASYSIIRQTTPGLGGALFVGGSSNSTPSTGSYSALTTGQGLLSFIGVGDTGSNLDAQGAALTFVTDGNWSTTSAPGKIQLQTTQPSAVNYTVAETIDSGQHVYYHGTAPSVATGAGDCGTTPVIGTNANDMAGYITVGSSTNGGKCTVTFANVTAWTAAPICHVSNTTSAARPVYPVPTPTTTTLVIQAGATLTAGDVLSYSCRGVN